MQVNEVSRLAYERGCRLNAMFTDTTSLYWVENSYFIGRPFSNLDDLVLFLRQLPSVIIPPVEDLLAC